MYEHLIFAKLIKRFYNIRDIRGEIFDEKFEWFQRCFSNDYEKQIYDINNPFARPAANGSVFFRILGEALPHLLATCFVAVLPSAICIAILKPQGVERTSVEDNLENWWQEQ